MEGRRNTCTVRVENAGLNISYFDSLKHTAHVHVQKASLKSFEGLSESIMKAFYLQVSLIPPTFLIPLLLLLFELRWNISWFPSLSAILALTSVTASAI